jgi:electron-transferring-flavoprotein dehydrogenase
LVFKKKKRKKKEKKKKKRWQTEKKKMLTRKKKKKKKTGIDKAGKAKGTFERGMELHAKHTIFAEGCRGSLSRQVMDRFDLRKDCDVPTFGIGLKEVWRLDPSKHVEGTVVHSIGWPTRSDTYAGSFMYHAGDNMLSIGYVIGLDYANPYTNPYREFQAFKHHPMVRDVLEGGTCEVYGARALVEGGLQSLPKMTFGGGVLVGDAAGTLVVPKIKGSHTAIKSGALAAEAVHEAILQGGKTEATSYADRFRSSWVYDQLHEGRNVRPSFAKWGLAGGVAYSGIDQILFRGKAPWTFAHHQADHEALKPAAECKPIEYPKPDGVVSFDLLTNLARSGTNHNHDQPAHLTLKDDTVPTSLNLPVFDGPEGRYCPAGVYEYVEDNDAPPAADGTPARRLNINAQNCLHCKTCDIKDPSQNIVWVVPEGGGGPAYPSM